MRIWDPTVPGNMQIGLNAGFGRTTICPAAGDSLKCYTQNGVIKEYTVNYVRVLGMI